MGAGAHRSSRFFRAGLRPNTPRLISRTGARSMPTEVIVSPGLQVENGDALGAAGFVVYR